MAPLLEDLNDHISNPLVANQKLAASVNALSNSDASLLLAVNEAVRVYTSAESTVGISETEALSVPGVLATDEVIAVSQKAVGSANLPLLGWSDLVDDGITGIWSANPGAGATVLVAVRRIQATEIQSISFSGEPDSGSFVLNYGPYATSALDFDASASDVQTALRLLPGLIAITVTGSVAEGFLVTFTGVAGDLDLLTVTDNTLEIAAVIEQQTIIPDNSAIDGTFKLNYAGNPTSVLQYDASAATIQAALRLLAGLESVTVDGDLVSLSQTITVTFVGVDGDAELLTVTDNTIPAVILTVSELAQGTDAEAVDVTVSEIIPG